MPNGVSTHRPRGAGSLWAWATILALTLAASLRAGAPYPGSDAAPPEEANAAAPAAALGSGAEQFHRDVEPILTTYCYDCHANGTKEGSVTLDEFASDDAVLANRDLWWRALKMLRAGMMPPAEAERPTPDQIATIDRWIKSSVFLIDPANPDPGRVTVRRLNRVEYRNTIRDLMGVDFDVQTQFPPDDTGNGFDTMADVLTMSPLLLEKYIAAAESIVAKAVPTVSSVVDEQRIGGGLFRSVETKANGEDSKDGDAKDKDDKDKDEKNATKPDMSSRDPLVFSYYEQATAVAKSRIKNKGQYHVALDLKAEEKWVDGEGDHNRCRLTFNVDGKRRVNEEFVRQEGQPYHFEFDEELDKGEHEFTLAVEPLTPDEKQIRTLTLKIDAVTLRGPVDVAHRVAPPNYAKFFPRMPPEDADARRAYATELLGKFATKAFRRRVEQATAERLAALAESVYSNANQTFESGVAQAMAAVLASPRFLFREEALEPDPGHKFPLIDEYALASRLSYFLWSSMPDDELFQLARDHKLRENLPKQVERMLGDRKSDEFIKQYAGQWLRARDVESWLVDGRAVQARENPDRDRDKLRGRFRELQRKDPEKMTPEEKEEFERVRKEFRARFDRLKQAELDGDLRRAMRRETEMLFERIVREDRSLMDLVDSNYTYLNERLATHYGIEGVKGKEMQLVELPADSPRGGIITEGTTLVITSNPDRTSPAKRGLYVLETILGTPPPPPPPNIPSLEQSENNFKDHAPTARELLEIHRAEPLCSACHNRMDPLGLALENFNALGIWRDQERKQPIDGSGQLITGEQFSGVKELKRILATTHQRDFYRCASEKMLTYALGRGLEYYDVEAVDEILARVEKADGKMSALLTGIIESAPFQRIRPPEASESQTAATTADVSAPQ